MHCFHDNDFEARRRYYLAELDAKFKVLVERLETLSPENLEKLYSVLSEYDNIVALVAEKLSALDGLIGSTDEAIDTRVTNIETTLESVRKNAVDKKNLNDAVNQLRSMINNIKIPTNTPSVNPDNSGSTQTPSVDLSGIEAQIKSISADISAIANRVATLEGIDHTVDLSPVTVLAEQVTALASKVAALESGNTGKDYETRIMALEAAIANLSETSDVKFNSVTANVVKGVVYQ